MRGSRLRYSIAKRIKVHNEILSDDSTITKLEDCPSSLVTKDYTAESSIEMFRLKHTQKFKRPFFIILPR